ncbi:MAG: alkaline phosphatase D family protein [Acidimicrobiales bacterium]|nr:alkaline phosphatase D family protein [Acidimicrobiales bacterium]
MNARGTGDERLLNGGVTRRGFLLGAASMVALGACGSGGDGGDGGGGASGSGGATPTPTTAAVTGPSSLRADPFTLGVASGDPRPDSVILWTRLAPDPLARDGAGGMGSGPVDVAWDVATDDAFTELIGSGVATAAPEFGHSVHVDATGLDPAGEYFYRFRVGDFTSPVGRTRTLPAADASPEQVRLGIANCQHLEAGFYAAYRHLADEDVDLVVHLGDYIYELPATGGPDGNRSSLPALPPKTLEEFRLRYASYKVDPDLQAAHAAAPFALVWDDHEVSDNYMGDTLPNGDPPAAVLELRTAAYQAWWENLPVRLDPPDGPDLDIYHDVVFGDLARLYLLDERQYADEPPCRGETVPYDYGHCDAVGDERTRLGADQEAWLDETARQGGVSWNLLGTPVALAGIDAGTGDEPKFFLDLWDGYPVARQQVIDLLAEVDNPVVISGDYHQGMVLAVNEVPFDTDSPLVATEFMAPPISSVLFSDDVSERTPQLRQQLDGHGYLVIEATPEALTAEFRMLDDVRDPDSGIETASTWRVDAGDPAAAEV